MKPANGVSLPWWSYCSFYPPSEIALKTPRLPASQWLHWMRKCLSLLHPMPQRVQHKPLKCISTNSLLESHLCHDTQEHLPLRMPYQKEAVDKKQWQHYLCHISLGYLFMRCFPMFHFRRRNAREVINDSSVIINVLGSCNTRTLQTQLNWTSKTFCMFWFLKNKQQIFSWVLLFFCLFVFEWEYQVLKA